MIYNLLACTRTSIFIVSSYENKSLYRFFYNTSNQLALALISHVHWTVDSYISHMLSNKDKLAVVINGKDVYLSINKNYEFMKVPIVGLGESETIENIDISQNNIFIVTNQHRVFHMENLEDYEPGCGNHIKHWDLLANEYKRVSISEKNTVLISEELGMTYLNYLKNPFENWHRSFKRFQINLSMRESITHLDLCAGELPVLLSNSGKLYCGPSEFKPLSTDEKYTHIVCSKTQYSFLALTQWHKMDEYVYIKAERQWVKKNSIVWGPDSLLRAVTSSSVHGYFIQTFDGQLYHKLEKWDSIFVPDLSRDNKKKGSFYSITKVEKKQKALIESWYIDVQCSLKAGVSNCQSGLNSAAPVLRPGPNTGASRRRHIRPAMTQRKTTTLLLPMLRVEGDKPTVGMVNQKTTLPEI